MKKWFARRSSQCEPVENYLAEPTESALEIVLNCARAGPAETHLVMRSIKQSIEGKDGKRASVGLHLLSLMVLGHETLAQAVATPKWTQRLVNLAEGTTKTFIRQQIVASVAKWASLYMNHPILFANFDWANKKLNKKFEPQDTQLAAEDDGTKAADRMRVKSAAGETSKSVILQKAEFGKPSATLQSSSSASVHTSKLSESTERVKQAIRAALDDDWLESTNVQQTTYLRRGSFSSLNPGSPLVNSESRILDERHGQLDFLRRCLQQVPNLMALNDATLEDIHNPNVTTSMEDLSEDIEVLENFQEDIRAIAAWNILQKDNEDHLVLLQCSYLFGETARLWKKKLSGADAGTLALEVETLVRPGSAEKKKREKLDTSVAKEALTALENKQNMEKQIDQLHKQNAASQNDVIRLHAKLAETEFEYQTKTATLQETVADLIDEIESLKSDLQTISKIPKEKLLLWALREKEMSSRNIDQNSEQRSNVSSAHELSSFKNDASNSDMRIRPIQEGCSGLDESEKQTTAFKRLQMDFKDSQAQLKECQDKLRLKSEEVLLMQLKLKENGGQVKNPIDTRAYILNLEDTITSLSEELSGLKDELMVAKDMSQSRLDEVSSSALLMHQKRFLSDRNALIATHGKLMMSMAQMSHSFSSEIRSQLSTLRENVSETNNLLRCDVADAIWKLQISTSSKIPLLQNETEAKTLSTLHDVSSSMNELTSGLGTANTSGPMQATLQSPKKEKGFFSSIFARSSVKMKGDKQNPSMSRSDTVLDPAGRTSATAHLKTVFAQAKGAVEAQEALLTKLAAEAHAAALLKVEEEWAAAANAKIDAESRMLKEVMEANSIVEAKAAAEAHFAAEEKDAVEAKARTNAQLKAAEEATVLAEAVPRVVTNDAADEEDFSDVSAFSDDDNLYFEKNGDAVGNNTNDEDSAVLAQAIIAATLAMSKPTKLIEVLNATEVTMRVPEHTEQPVSTRIYIPKERRKLCDRPASAESSGSSFTPSANFNATFLNHVMIEDAKDTAPLQEGSKPNMAEISGRKLLAGTSKANVDIPVSPPKEAFLDSALHSKTSQNKRNAFSHGTSESVPEKVAGDKPVRIVRVSTSNKILQEPQTAKAKQMEVAGDQHPATAAYSNATLSLKKMRERLTKAQLPNESAELDTSALNPTKVQENVGLLSTNISVGDIAQESSVAAETSSTSTHHKKSQRAHYPAKSLAETSLQKDFGSEMTAFRKSSLPEQQQHASLRQDLDDWNVEDL